MQIEMLQEARRQAEICNACRYCEGYCSVFPSLQSNRAFSDGDLTQLANLCHNCRGCYYACQYTAPHEFDLNLPKALAELRRDSWETFAWPKPLASRFQSHGGAIAFALVSGFAVLFLILHFFGAGVGATSISDRAGAANFYDILAHNVMVAIFLPAFLLPLISMGVSLRRYWRAVDGNWLKLNDIMTALGMAGRMKDLAAGHGEGCNFEDEDRFSHTRRYAHQAIMFGFILCFAATSAGTVLHYLFDMKAPYAFWSLPKLLGVSGGVLLTFGCIEMVRLKLRSDRNLGDAGAWGGEIGFILLLCFVAVSGLLLYAVSGTAFVAPMLALHLGSVLTFFLLTPFTKMAHGFYRFTALIRDAQRKRIKAEAQGGQG